jgi:N-acyl-L-homoserine lactone synthetase
MILSPHRVIITKLNVLNPKIFCWVHLDLTRITQVKKNGKTALIGEKHPISAAIMRQIRNY